MRPIKADDTALIGLISKDDDSAYLSQVDSFVNHCDANYLELNVSKTKEMVIDFRQTSPDPQLVDINNPYKHCVPGEGHHTFTFLAGHQRSQ